ncbi:DedA family protein [Candidatus Curtissbacteria bacterium]|nr:DedA family protein [Candidatus Curtissbacteria bacterium]
MHFTLDQIYIFIEVYKYLILYPLVIAEGTVVTVIAGFLASLGVLNIYLVIIVAILGDLTGDHIYYFIGRLGREKFIGRWGHFLGIGIGRVKELEKKYKHHAGKMLFLGKFAFGLEVLNLVVAGAARVPYRKFMAYIFIPTILKYTFFALLGYFFGSAYVTISVILHDLILAIPVFLAILVAAFFIYRFFMKKIFKNI